MFDITTEEITELKETLITAVADVVSGAVWSVPCGVDDTNYHMLASKLQKKLGYWHLLF
ncbi:MAG: hypothetical protein R3B69_02265 [Candidatus Paceibacterota bacterium]